MEKAKNFFAILGIGITVGIVIVVILLFVIRATPTKITVGGVEFEIPTSTLVTTTTSEIATKSPCPYQAQTDMETITNILNSEANAILQKDINVIKQIYAENAIIRDAQSGQTWNSPIKKYQELFTESDFQKLEHFGFQLISSDGNIALITGGVRGSFININSGQVEEFESDTRSDHWTFEKNSDRCWLITTLTYNATNEKFP